MSARVALPRTHADWRLLLREAVALPLEDLWFPEHAYFNQFRRKFKMLPQRNPHLRLDGPRPSATLLLLSPPPGGPPDNLCITLTKRTTRVNSHKGEMSFPGGRLDAGETAEAAARREALEEVGVAPDAYEVLGPLTPISSGETGSAVTAFVALAPRPVSPRVESPDEVSSIHYLHLSNVVADAPHSHARGIRYHTLSGRDEPTLFPNYFASASQTVPCAPLVPSKLPPGTRARADDLGLQPLLPADVPGEVVWGLTAFMLSEFLARVAKALERRHPGDAVYDCRVLLRASPCIVRDPNEPDAVAK